MIEEMLAYAITDELRFDRPEFQHRLRWARLARAARPAKQPELPTGPIVPSPRENVRTLLGS